MDIALLEEAKSIILEAVGISLVLLAIYVCVLPVAAQIMISISVIIIVLLSVAIGTIIVVKYCGGLGGDVDGDETTANTTVDLIVGLACFVFAAVVCCCSCWLRPKLETAKDLLQLSVLFLIESPDVVVLILLKFIVNIGLVAVMLGFGGMVLSTTELVSVGDTYQYEVEAETWVYFFVFLFLMYWIICTFRAWITFGIAFAVQMDYDRRRHGSGGLFGGLRGFSSGVKSIGSFTLAGLCKAVFGWNLGILNALMNFLGLSCLSPITFLDNISLSAMSHDGTLGFCAAGCSTAARQSRSSVLHSFNSIFELIGLLFIPPIGGICAYLLAQQSDMAKPLQVAILSALVNLIVVVPVLGAVTIIAEAFVYCDELFEEGEPEKETVVQKTKTFFAGSMKGEKGEDTDPLLAAKSSAKL
jgi:hypothetical protein